MNRKSYFAGLVFIIIGLGLLVSRYIFGYEVIHFESGDFWPLIVLALGAVFEMLYYGTGRTPGFLVPGGILTTISLLFIFEVATDWRFAEYTWPVYIMAVAVGLFQLYLHGGKPRGLMIAGSIVGGIGLFSMAIVIFQLFISTVDVALVIPLVLILAGLFFMFGRKSINKSW